MCFETFAYSLLIHFVAKKETLYLVGIVPKYVAWTSVVTVAVHMLMTSEVVESLITGTLFFVTYRVAIGLSWFKALVTAVLCQLIYQGWKFGWLALSEV